MSNENYYVTRIRELSPVERRETLNCILDWFFEAEHSALPEPDSKKKKRRRNRHGLTVIKGNRR
jgi:hypothetical protein